jgi:hypothetical protein
VILGSLSQAQSCLQKRLVSELPLTCGRRPRAASDLRAPLAFMLRSMRTVSTRGRCRAPTCAHRRAAPTHRRTWVLWTLRRQWGARSRQQALALASAAAPPGCPLHTTDLRSPTSGPARSILSLTREWQQQELGRQKRKIAGPRWRVLRRSSGAPLGSRGCAGGAQRARRATFNPHGALRAVGARLVRGNGARRLPPAAPPTGGELGAPVGAAW